MNIEYKRTTVYFDAKLYRNLRLKAAEVNRSLSDLVNEAVGISLAEDVEDLDTFSQGACEPNLSFKDVVKNLKRRRKI